MDNLFKGRNGAGRRYDFAKELEDFAKEIRDTPDDPDRYAAQMILLDRQSQKVRRGLCEMALEHRFNEEELKEICRYFEDELIKIEEFAEKISGEKN